jgi:hypothetical protein
MIKTGNGITPFAQANPYIVPFGSFSLFKADLAPTRRQKALDLVFSPFLRSYLTFVPFPPDLNT